jgi:hypothetical protein
MVFFHRIALAGLAAGLLTLAAATATSTADIAHRKFARIETGKLPAGTRIDLSAAELDAWAADAARLYAPGAARNIRLQLRDGAATGSMLVDFLKLRRAATGEEPGWLMKNLFAGERQVTVTGRFESRNRHARVDVDRVEVSGVPIEGATLNFLIDNFLRPTFPDVKVDQWFALGFRMDRFTVSPEGVSVYIGR